MKKRYVKPQTTAYAVPRMALLSGSNFDFEMPESSGDGFVNPGESIDPGDAL